MRAIISRSLRLLKLYRLLLPPVKFNGGIVVAISSLLARFQPSAFICSSRSLKLHQRLCLKLSTSLVQLIPS
jgi:hypothetical protein